MNFVDVMGKRAGQAIPAQKENTASLLSNQRQYQDLLYALIMTRQSKLPLRGSDERFPEEVATPMMPLLTTERGVERHVTSSRLYRILSR